MPDAALLERLEKLSPRRLALLAAGLEERLNAVEQARNEPIAVIGMGCRFPGGASSPQAFWDLLLSGRDAISEIPRDRWNIDDYYDTDADKPGKMATRWGGFVEGHDRFDAPFFGISPREAASMDPQQRMLLEVTWEALEHAATAPEKLAGSKTGVFVGMCNADYARLRLGGSPERIDAYVATGSAPSIAAGRISYVLDLRGPSIAIDTSCSSSLVAVHLACQSLRSGDCSLALTGGSNSILAPETTITLSRSHMMAPDGRCKAFDASADGFVRGEGCGILVLKRLSDALRDHDRILGVIRGSAVGQDGRSSGLTAPNGPAQENVMREAMAAAGVQPSEPGYLEAHGTGTSLGDPIEVRALGRVLGEGRSPDHPLLLGSVKTNIGHLESAAGVAGIIKVILAFEHRTIPPHLHLKTINPHITLDFPCRIPTSATPWEPAKGPRIAGVSSFGFSGTNAHIILEEPPAAAPEHPEAERPMHALAISARSATALVTLAGDYARSLASAASPAKSVSFADFAFTANTGRSHFAHRAFVAAESAEQAASAINSWLTGSDAGIVQAGNTAGSQPEIALLFTGQGVQYPGMGRLLYDTQPVFRGALERCQEVLRQCLETPLLQVIYPKAGAETPLDETAYTQPALFALEYALAELWRSWGVVPSVVAGHSVGEYVAACVAGVFSLEDGLRLIVERARLMQALPRNGGMAAVFAGEEQVRRAIEPYAGTLDIAAFNDPENVVISGLNESLEAVLNDMAASGIRTQRLNVSHAFHSPLMEPMLHQFEQYAHRFEYSAPRIGFISNVTGGFLETAPDAAYWRQHVRSSVQFAAGIRAACAQGYNIFLEAGPAAPLLGMAQNCIPQNGALLLPSLRKSVGAWKTMLTSLGALYVRGVNVDWAGFDRSYRRNTLSLPTYPFERQRYWADPGQPNQRLTVGKDGAGIEDSFYRVQWQPEPRASDTAALLPQTADLATALESEFERLSKVHGLVQYDELLPRLNTVCRDYVLLALRRLGWNPAPRNRFTTDELAEQLKISTRRRRPFERLLRMLSEDGLITGDGDGWVVQCVPPVGDPDIGRDSLAAAYPAFHPELTVLAGCGRNLDRILTGVLDPLEILFLAEGAAAETIYTQSPWSQAYNGMFGRVMHEVASRLPQGSPLRILEIGAGTGATTACILPHLDPNCSEYVFTDLSKMFLARARDKFDAYPFVQYKILDIESDPASQGFGGQQFDVVLAANVLHATADLSRTLERVQKLLAPGGLLVLLEAGTPERWLDLTFGMTDGWWRFTDQDVRPDHPLLSAERWQRLLGACGFTQTSAAPASVNGRAAYQSILLARNRERRAARWVILADRSGFGAAVGEHIALNRGDCTLVYRADIDADEPAQYSRVLKALGRDGGNVAYLWSLDEEDDHDPAGAHRRVCDSALHLLQALAAADSPPVRLWLATRGAQSVSGEAPALAQAPLWGLGRMAALEHPERWGGLIDLDPAADVAAEAERFVREVEASSASDEVAFRNGVRTVARLAHAEREPGGEDGWKADGTYLITGGLGGLGLHVARRMAERGARHLTLVGRRAQPSNEQQAEIAHIERLGTSVRLLACDIADRSQVSAVLEDLARSGQPLRGVIHAAGVVGDGPLTSQTGDRFAQVMQPKVSGAWNLHLLTKSIPLDCFVLFSSTASLTVSAGQGAYPMANQFLDALAYYRRAQGLPAVSISWGSWRRIGMAEVLGDRAERVWSAQGVTPIDLEGGLHAFEALAHSRYPHWAVIPIDWDRFRQYCAAQGRWLPLVKNMVSAGAARAAIAAGGQDIAASLRAAPPEQHARLIAAHIGSIAARLLGVDSAASLDAHQPLSAVGLDSLMAVELRNRLQADFGVSFPIDRLLTDASVATLAFEVGTARQATHQAAPAAEGPVERIDSETAELLLSQVDELSGEEVNRLLEKLLAEK